MHFISIIITSALSQAIRYQIPEVEDPCSFKKIFTYFAHTLVAVAKDAASVAGQHGGGVATSAVSRQGRRCGSCRLHHSRERRCAGTGAAAANFPASVTRGLRDGVLGGPEEAAGAAMREALGASREAVLR